MASPAGRRRTGPHLPAALLCVLSAAPARAGAPPPAPSPGAGRGFDLPSPQFDRDAGAAAWIRTVSPPPPAAVVRCPEAPRCPEGGDASQVAWLFAGLATAGMLLSISWAARQHRRAQVIREELSRIRIQRTSQIRATRSLAERPLSPPGLGRISAPGQSLPPASQEPRSSPPTAVPDRALRDEADVRLTAAQAELAPLLATATAVEEWFRSRDVEAAVGGAGQARALFDRARRSVVAVAATFHALRDARLFPTTRAGIDQELARYWGQVNESVADVERLAGLVGGEEWLRGFRGQPTGESARQQTERLLTAARTYMRTRTSG